MSLIAGKQISGSVASASYALTASYAMNGGGSVDTSGFVTTSSFNAFTSSYSTGSFTGSFTGTLQGTASYANQSLSSSYATTASYVKNAQTASYILNAVSSSFATTASYILQAVSSSYSINSTSASYAGTASYVINALTASYVQNAQTASYILNAISSSYSTTASYYGGSVISSSYAQTASLAPNYVLTSTTSSMLQPYVLTSQTSSMSVATASYVQTAQTASYVLQAISSSYAITASYTQTASYVLNAVSSSYSSTSSYALNGGVTKISAGPNINISPVNGLGDVTITSFGTNIYNTATGSYGSFYDTGSQTAVSATAIYSMSLSTTDISNGVYVSGSSRTRVYVTNAGVYNFQFSAQFRNTDTSDEQHVAVWIRKNNISSANDVVDSNSFISVSKAKGGNPGETIAAWNFFQQLAAEDFIELLWHAETGGVITLETIAAGTNPTHPRTPSLILTAQRVDTFLSNTGSFSGSFTGNLIGTAQTASYVLNAISSSYANTASFVLNAVSSSFASTASFFSGIVTSASYASTASYVTQYQNVTPGFSGNYMLPVQAYQIITLSGGAADSATTRYYPFVPSSNLRIASIGAVLRASANPGTGSYRLGIYNSVDATAGGGPTKLPGSLLIDAGLITNTTTASAFTEIAITIANQPTLQRGVVYWAVIAASGSGTTCPGPSNNVYYNNFMGYGSYNTGTATFLPAIGLTVSSNAGTGFAATAVTTSYAFISTSNVLSVPIFRISGSSV